MVQVSSPSSSTYCQHFGKIRLYTRVLECEPGPSFLLGQSPGPNDCITTPRPERPRLDLWVSNFSLQPRLLQVIGEQIAEASTLSLNPLKTSKRTNKSKKPTLSNGERRVNFQLTVSLRPLRLELSYEFFPLDHLTQLYLLRMLVLGK